MGLNSTISREMTDREKLELDVKLAWNFSRDAAKKYHDAVAALDAFGPEPELKNETDDLVRKV